MSNFEHVSLFTVRLLDSNNTVELDGDFEFQVEIKHNIRAGSYVLAIGIDSYSQNIYFNSDATQIDILEIGDKEYKYKNYGLIDAEGTWQIKV